jgi:cytochrome P450
MRSKRDQVRAVADHVVADLPRGEAFDCLDLYASRLPAKMVTAVHGLPADESRWFAQ